MQRFDLKHAYFNNWFKFTRIPHLVNRLLVNSLSKLILIQFSTSTQEERKLKTRKCNLLPYNSESSKTSIDNNWNTQSVIRHSSSIAYSRVWWNWITGNHLGSSKNLIIKIKSVHYNGDSSNTMHCSMNFKRDHIWTCQRKHPKKFDKQGNLFLWKANFSLTCTRGKMPSRRQLKITSSLEQNMRTIRGEIILFCNSITIQHRPAIIYWRYHLRLHQISGSTGYPSRYLASGRYPVNFTHLRSGSVLLGIIILPNRVLRFLLHRMWLHMNGI